ncbi:hypothetical protein GCM10011494_16150 [Novosphingobium endophyticum]|uniref:Uncharacterized protein n=1 Tax=Novosphingobium endophyticum TaxID=1955250 RepID=A0A916X4A4_9SPHN|nr:hypothetical protein [Novosphingobium endophyticum]GGB98430.1 hypothetical protein GCM10011494_16150 [Novosphingobium endophyticum]
MKRTLRAAAALTASLLAVVPQVASAAQPACLSKTEARSLLVYALPQVIDGTRKRCEAVLPDNSYLRRHGSGLAARYGAQKARYWPEAKAAFLKLGNASDPQLGQFARNLPDESMQPLIDLTVEGMVSQSIRPETCEEIDLAIDLLSPLPPENTAGLIALFIEIGSETGKRARTSDKQASLGGFAICED